MKKNSITLTEQPSSRRAPLAICAASAILAAVLSTASAGTYSTNCLSDAFVATGATGSLSVSNFGGGGALLVAAPGLPLGEFQSVLQFDASGARASFDSQFGAGLWAVASVALQVTSQPHGNPIYNAVASGSFHVSLMRNNSWVEGSGTANIPTTDGITYATLASTYIDSAADQPLGTFPYDGAAGGAYTCSLKLTPGLAADVAAGSHLSLRLYAADTNISFQFNSRLGAPSSSRPLLTMTALPQPRISHLAMATGSLILSATNGPVGAFCSVVTSTDPGLPLTNWSIVATNSFNQNGTCDVTNAINPAQAQGFYAIMIP